MRSRMEGRVVFFSRPWCKFLLDLALWTGAVPLAYFLRFEGLPPAFLRSLFVYLAVGLPVRAVLTYIFSLHRQSWQNVSLTDLWHLAWAVGLYTATMFAISLGVSRWVVIPRSVPIIGGGLAFLLLGAVRMAVRSRSERSRRRDAGVARRVLVVGAGEAGTMIAREMLRHPEIGGTPVGFLDDDPSKGRVRFMGVRVLGGLEDLTRAADRVHADEVLIAIPSAPGHVVRRVVELARKAGLGYRIIPGMYEILAGKVSVSQIREVSLEDLLRRDPVELNLEEISDYLSDRVVLVTGAGGSIGAEIVRQVARFGPKEVLLLGRGENSLFELSHDLERRYPALPRRTLVVDVQQRGQLEHVFRTYKPQVVFHAAAHKHVPLMEENPAAAVLNNVFGTQNLVELSLEHNVERFVNVSTDKVVNPTSVMGASKRAAEYIVQEAAHRAPEGRAYVSVRFGNVLGSRGSVVPLFKEQIRRGGPVTVTHPDMKRYFMTIPEAAQLVLQAGGLGENGSVYVLDMGEPVKIVELAEELVRLSGLEPGEDIEIEFTGLRPGEKLFEDFMTAEEGTTATRHEKIYVARGTAPPEDLSQGLGRLHAAADVQDEQGIRAALKELVPTYASED